MKILFIRWKSVWTKDMEDILMSMGYNIIEHHLEFGEQFEENEEIEVEEVVQSIKKNGCQACFSVNFFPVVSLACESLGIPYVSWIFDCPHYSLYTKAGKNSCNYIFVFEKEQEKELTRLGYPNVEFLPLAVNVERVGKLQFTKEDASRYGHDISFIGNMYLDNFYYQVGHKMSEYLRGYLKGIAEAQKKVYGYNFLRSLITDSILEKVNESISIEEFPNLPDSTRMIFADQFMGKYVSCLERQENMFVLSRLFPNVVLYSGSDTSDFPTIDNRGRVDYFTQMSKVFSLSKINLNMTIRTITTAIPLRCFDVMGAGGFLLSNYQEDLLEYFEPGIDFDYYGSKEELVDKCRFYLENDDLREKIQIQGYQKIVKYHTLQERMKIFKKVLI